MEPQIGVKWSQPKPQRGSADLPLGEGEQHERSTGSEKSSRFPKVPPFSSEEVELAVIEEFAVLQDELGVVADHCFGAEKLAGSTGLNIESVSVF